MSRKPSAISSQAANHQRGPKTPNHLPSHRFLAVSLQELSLCPVCTNEVHGIQDLQLEVLREASFLLRLQMQGLDFEVRDKIVDWGFFGLIEVCTIEWVSGLELRNQVHVLFQELSTF